jgi:hypothetical protein
MATRIIASGDARPHPTAAEPRGFLTSTETSYRLYCAPEVATLQINPAAPDSSLIALALARIDAVDGVLGVFLQDVGDLGENQQHALEGVACAAQELRLLLNELQRRDGKQYGGVGA